MRSGVLELPSDSHAGSQRVETRTARPYQLDALRGIDRELDELDRRSTLLVLPTGCGKTFVFARRALKVNQRGGRVLVVAHRGELLDQAAKHLRELGLNASVDQADRRGSHFADVVVGSVQTLRGARLERYAPDHFAEIIVDECHHARAKSYGAIFERFPRARILGVTATAKRADGKALGDVFESVAYTYDMRTAIREGYLAPLRAKRILVEDLDLDDVRTHHGDFDQSELSQLLLEDKNLLGVVDPLVREAGDRKTLFFGVDVAHAHAVAELLNHKRPGSAIALDGKAKPEQRAAVLALFRRGAFQYLCNCALFTEGFDEPSIECVAIARPTQSWTLYVQMLGRGTRNSPGKPDCLVLDFVGNSAKHRLIGPVDALAGHEVSEATRKLVEKQLDGQLELDAVLENAEQQAAEEARKRRERMFSLALTEYRTREIDVFLGDHMAKFDRDSPAAQRPATPDQLAEIEVAKLGKPPAGISEAEAAAMLDAVKARRKAGLCTVAQARLLERLGCDSKTITFTRAGQLIGMVASKKAWNRAGMVLHGQPEYRPGRRA